MRGRLVAREALGADVRRRMEQLLAAHFEGVTHASFNRDLDEKNWVVLLEEGGRLSGFTTLLTYESSVAGEPLAVVYSGDTIMERGAHGSAALPQAWIAAVRALHEGGLGGNIGGAGAAPSRPQRRLFWLLLTSGFRTYRFLPVFWRDFQPCPGTPPPPAARSLLDALARERLGSCYLPELGIARLAAPQLLARDLREVPAGKLADPYVALFLASNPGWESGDELVCLTEIAAHNLTAAGRRMWQRGRIDHAPAAGAPEARGVSAGTPAAGRPAEAAE
ncbi:MAG TPA: hypothetical protein VHR45_01380 [Thermoanaerobaculia bacterium]|nr:hypothetical protein [Thermoanaerobaculia bacterium]